MRRKDREMSKEYGFKIIDQSSYGTLSMLTIDHEPYGIPISIVREVHNLYFHSAKSGRKVEAFANNPLVCVTFVGEVNVPENFSNEELENISKDENKVSQLVSSVFTTEFESAIVKGRISLVIDIDEKVKAMKLICEKYTPTKMKYFNLAVKSGLDLTNMYKIEIEEITAKRKKYDLNGEEMKFGRME